MRGELTGSVKLKAKELLNINITQEELRLLPYLHYLLVNKQVIDYAKISIGEREIMGSWICEGWVVEESKAGSTSTISVSKEFWTTINEIFWLSYVLRSDK